MNISVLIPTKNGGGLFAEVMCRLAKQRVSHSVELIVVDSGSSDETVNDARRHGARVIEISPHDFNHGLTRDIGISQAGGEVIVLLTQDALPANDFLIESLIQPFLSLKVAGVYARQSPRPEADVLTKRNLNHWLTGRKEPNVKAMKSYEWYESLLPIEKYYFCNFDNVCSAVRRSVWQKISFGRNDFGEDIDWAERVLRAGFEIAYEPTAVVIHSHDRPISYEYKRTYMCHQKLFRQFQLRTVPSMKHVLRCTALATQNDCRYVAAEEKSFIKRIKMYSRIPLLNFASAYGQYRGAKDEFECRAKKMIGV